MADLAWRRPIGNLVSDGFSSDAGSAAERGRQRVWRLNLTVAAALGFRGAMWLSTVIYIPLTVRYLGPGRFGLWVAMTSVIALFGFADCGIGYGLTNHVAQAVGRGAEDTIRRSISSTFYVLSAVALLGCLLFAAAYPFIPWQSVFRISGQHDAAEPALAVTVMAVAFFLTLPFTTVQRVQAAYQQGYEAQLWEIGGVVFSLGGLLVAIHMQAGLPLLAIVFSLGPLAALALNWLVYFVVRHPLQLPVWRNVDLHLVANIVKEGGYFFVLQVSTVLVYSIDSFIVLHYFGQTALAEYTLLAKLFLVVPSLTAVWFGALWPAYAESMARADYSWVRRMLLRSVIAGGLGCSAVSLAIAVFARPVVYLWTGAAIHPSVWLLAGFVLSSTVGVTIGAIGAFLTGTNFIRGQAVLVLVQTALTVALKILLCKYWNMSGVVWATAFGYLVVILPAYILIGGRRLREHIKLQELSHVS